jgi:membrane protein YqaA with SNARE-associated domain
LDWLTPLIQFGYIGIFLISCIGALTIIFPIPYLIILYALGSTLDPVLLAISSGLGSALGELSGYIIGYYGRAIISDQMKRRMEFMLKVFNHYGVIAIFLFALTPLPDDLLFIPLGMMHYALPKALLACFLGKLLMSFAIAYSGRISFEFIKILFGDSGWLFTVATIGLLGVIIVMMLRFDWEGFFERRFMNRKDDEPTE